MIEPKTEDIGRKIVCVGNRYPGGRIETGVIASFNSSFVFVRYGADERSKATSRQDLEWENRYYHEWCASDPEGNSRDHP